MPDKLKLEREIERHHGFRSLKGIPMERIVIDPRALTVAADEYAQTTGDVDEVALGRAILTYLEGAEP